MPWKFLLTNANDKKSFFIYCGKILSKIIRRCLYYMWWWFLLSFGLSQLNLIKRKEKFMIFFDTVVRRKQKEIICRNTIIYRCVMLMNMKLIKETVLWKKYADIYNTIYILFSSDLVFFPLFFFSFHELNSYGNSTMKKNV